MGPPRQIHHVTAVGVNAFLSDHDRWSRIGCSVRPVHHRALLQTGWKLIR